MKLDRWIERTLAIQSIPAPTFQESERAEYLGAEFLTTSVSATQQDSIGNLFARIPGGDRPPVIVSAHLDTVFSGSTDLSHQKTHSRLIGPGVGDNAVALAALLELAEDLPFANPGGDVWLVANVGEEGLGNLRGMREVVAKFGDRVSAYVVLEGMALGHIYHRALPVRRYRITIRTEGGHSWIHAGRPSALHEMLRLGTLLLEIPVPSAPRSTLNVGSLAGGQSINSIADLAILELDLRSESDATLADLATRLQAVVSTFGPPAVEVDLELIGSRPGGDIASDHPLVLAALESFARAGQKKSFLEFGSTDASVPLSRGLPSVCVGMTKGGEAHTTREYIEIHPMGMGYRAVADLIAAAFAII